MKYTKQVGLGLLVVAAMMAVCNQGHANASVGKTDSQLAKFSQDKGPHGGLLFDLGKYTGEFLVEHAQKKATIYILAEDEKTLAPVECKELILTTKEAKTKDGKVVPAMTIKLLPQDEVKGKSWKFVGTHPALENVADYEGTVIGKINGKPTESEFEE